MYFIIFKNKNEKRYKLYTNTIFSEEKEAEEVGRKSMKRNEQYKVLYYDKENYDKYWS